MAQPPPNGGFLPLWSITSPALDSGTNKKRAGPRSFSFLLLDVFEVDERIGGSDLNLLFLVLLVVEEEDFLISDQADEDFLSFEGVIERPKEIGFVLESQFLLDFHEGRGFGNDQIEVVGFVAVGRGEDAVEEHLGVLVEGELGEEQAHHLVGDDGVLDVEVADAGEVARIEQFGDEGDVIALGEGFGEFDQGHEDVRVIALGLDLVVA